MNITVLGAVLIILGILAMLAPGVTGLSIAMVVGVVVLIGGIGRIIWAFQSGSLGKGIVKLAIGGLTLLCGIMLIGNPIFASSVLTILLALYFILDGIAEIAAGMKIGTGAGGGWLLFAGVISVLLGAMIWAQYPLSGAWALGILFGIKLIMSGVVMLTGGLAIQAVK